jgi:hypothetical protein
VKTAYALYHKTHPDQAATDRRGTYDAPDEAAAAATGQIVAWHTWGPDGWAGTAGDRDHWLILAEQVPETDPERIELALDVIRSYGQTDGDHHKAWVIAQVVRYLAEDSDAWVREYCDGEDGPETYDWDEGIAP